ncbi:carbamoylphosphate synthase small subunit [Cytobacillus eiseniae]|uniref:Carbamoylphosphate synthase small subunit n=1 Tax=Cytobacillus eiseniae TaxID=762947 RepID=A0ABS4RE16_9BACI|nr:carbamoyl-phosphate synthase domain-containing protein [Cytobacillus eiseniae]MBP2241149.1 carbamoylphosphate synthase small subunit [Cytobacillus eiseniae]
MNGYLYLDGDQCFKGQWLTAPLEHNVNRKIIFFTGMIGYEDVLIDPTYTNQIVIFTYPLIGTYGISYEEYIHKKPSVGAVVVYEAVDDPSHYQSTSSLTEYLEKWNIPMLSHVDTRAVVKKLRNRSSMSAILSSSEPI